MNTVEKLRQIRETECDGRKTFGEKINVSMNTIKKYEERNTPPKWEVIEAILKVWPEYTMWLIHDETNAESGQVSPDIKRENLQIGNQKEVS